MGLKTILRLAAEDGEQPGLEIGVGWDGDVGLEVAAAAEVLCLVFEKVPEGLYQVVWQAGVLAGRGGEVPTVDGHIDQPVGGVDAARNWPVRDGAGSVHGAGLVQRR